MPLETWIATTFGKYLHQTPGEMTPLNYPFLTVELVNIHFHNLQAKPIKTRNTIEWLITSFTVLSFMIDQIAFPLSQVFFVQSFLIAMIGK